MNVLGIIAEYNPFHKGHAFHIESARKQADADYVVVVLSPDFVQRGEPSLLDKYFRARCALMCGADLVLEMPVACACGSAEHFARSGVQILNSLGVVNTLSFGAETPDLSVLEAVAELLNSETEEYRTALKEHLSRGYSFPEAREAAVLSCHTGTLNDSVKAGLLRSPNNILAVEYLKANIRTGRQLSVLPVQRSGSAYHDTDMSGSLSSAAAIRHTVQGTISGKPADNLSAAIPEVVHDLFFNELSNAVFPDDFAQAVQLKLLSTDSFTEYTDVSQGLANRLSSLKYACQGLSWKEMVDLICTREMTRTRIQRVLLHLLLGITNEHSQYLHHAEIYPYIRVLGFRKDAASLLRAVKTRGRTSLITKYSAVQGIADVQESADGKESADDQGHTDVNRLTDVQGHKEMGHNESIHNIRMDNIRMHKEILLADVYASHLYRSIRCSKYHLPFRTEYEYSPVILS